MKGSGLPLPVFVEQPQSLDKVKIVGTPHSPGNRFKL